jgi:hypothetical protein
MLSFGTVPSPCVQLKPLHCGQQNGHDHPFLDTSSESLPPPNILTHASLLSAMGSSMESSKTNGKKKKKVARASLLQSPNSYQEPLRGLGV